MNRIYDQNEALKEDILVRATKMKAEKKEESEDKRQCKVSAHPVKDQYRSEKDIILKKGGIEIQKVKEDDSLQAPTRIAGMDVGTGRQRGRDGDASPYAQSLSSVCSSESLSQSST